MAEGFAKKYIINYTIKSAGTNPEPINPLAFNVMKEINIDLSDHHSKSILDENLESYDFIITLCGDAKDKCITLSNLANKHIHWDINDPAKISGSKAQKLDVYRKARDQIEEKIKSLKNELN